MDNQQIILLPNKIKKSKDSKRIDLDGRILVAHQAEFLPWLGFISKVAMGDVFFILDTVQFTKKYFENRNKIRQKGDQGWFWINIPCKGIQRYRVSIMDVHINMESDWKDKILRQFELVYSKASFFEQIFQEVRDIIFQSTDKLVELNVAFIKYAFKKFNINVPIYRTSELISNGYDIGGLANELIISMCKAANANIYVFGQSGKEYVDRALFKKNNITPVFQKFEHPVYHQIHGDFHPHMSFIDLLFNCGQKSVEILGKSEYEL